MPARETVFAKISDESVLEKTGKTWAQWFRILDRMDVLANGHRHAALSLRRTYKLSPWWSQAVTIRYEWERGLRTVKNQRQAKPGHSLFKNRPKNGRTP